MNTDIFSYFNYKSSPKLLFPIVYNDSQNEYDKRINEIEKHSRMRICVCSADSVYDILEDIPREIEKNTYPAITGILKYLNDKNMVLEDIDETSKSLIIQCIKFLLFFEKYKDDDIMKKRCQTDIHKSKYITISSFIYNYLAIQRNSGYDYILMNFLQHIGVINHGAGIRSAWLENNIWDVVLTEEDEQKMKQWVINAPDDI